MGKHGDRRHVTGSFHRVSNRLRAVEASLGDQVRVTYRRGADRLGEVSGELLGVTDRGSLVIRERILWFWKRERFIGARSVGSIEKL